MKWKAKWIWYPEKNHIPNSFVLFRYELFLLYEVKIVTIAVSAETRYTLYVNKHEVCSGPPPYDPRWQYYDEIEISKYLNTGKNIIGVRVWYIGNNTGTSIKGAPPGFILQGRIIYKNGIDKIFYTDSKGWLCHLCKSYLTGRYRWILRSFNEEFDARLFPENWLEIDFKSKDFVKPIVLEVPSGKPMYFMNAVGDMGCKLYPKIAKSWNLIKRDIPFMEEKSVSPNKILNFGKIIFHVSPDDYYDRGLYENITIKKSLPERKLNFPYRIEATGKKNLYILFDFGLLFVGRLHMELTASEGTIIDISFDERRRNKKLLMPSPRLKSWLRYICREGFQTWTSVDFESLRYLQMVIRNNLGPITINKLEVLHRRYPVALKGSFFCSDKNINKLWNVTVYTLEHTCHESIVDNNNRERQQYSGDIEWAKLALYYIWGDYTLARKALLQFKQGQMPNGQFMTCWPSGIRLELLGEYKMMGVKQYAYEIIDHSLIYIIGVWYYYLFTGDTSLIKEVYPSIKKFWIQLRNKLDKWGMIDPDIYGEGVIYIDHTGWVRYKDNMASCNMLYYWTLSTIEKMSKELKLNEDVLISKTEKDKLKQNIIKRFFNKKLGTFINNPEEVRNGQLPRQHESTLSLAIILDIVPITTQKSLFSLIKNSKSGIGRGTPATANFVYWAASKIGEVNYILKDFRKRWLKMPSIIECGTIGEYWKDNSGREVNCQNLPVPGYILPGIIAGIRPLKPGFKIFSLDPLLGDIKFIKATVPTPSGKIIVEIQQDKKILKVKLNKPQNLTFIVSERYVLKGEVKKEGGEFLLQLK